MLIDKSKEHVISAKGEGEFQQSRTQMTAEIFHNLCFFKQHKIFEKATKTSLVSFLVNLFRNTNDPENLQGLKSTEIDQRKLLMLRIFNILMDIAYKEIKPIQLIKDTGPNFILA